jgi:hypothetical protein
LEHLHISERHTTFKQAYLGNESFISNAKLPKKDFTMAAKLKARKRQIAELKL